MTDIEYNQLLEKAIQTLGAKKQEMKLLEEMSELQEAILKHRQDRDTVDHVCEELADVIIMVAQMSLAYGTDKVEYWIERKAERLEQRLKEYKK